MKRVVLVGDSTRLRYQPYVEHMLASAALEVSGPTENCETSRRIRENLGPWVIDRSPDVVHLNCGLHDLRYDPGSDRPQVSLEEYAENLDHILATLMADAISVVWATSTPVNERRHQAGRHSRRYEADVIAYNELSRSVASRYGIPCNDLYQAVEDQGGDAVLGADGVHLTDAGYEFLGRHVARAIRLALDRSAALMEISCRIPKRPTTTTPSESACAREQ